MAVDLLTANEQQQRVFWTISLIPTLLGLILDDAASFYVLFQ